jgi:ADP-ribosylglycohydrolase
MDSLNPKQLERAAGAVLGAAVGDALGAGYELAAPPAFGHADMIGGGLGNFAPGQWTDDTSQSVPILQTLAAGADLRTPAERNQVGARWLAWYAEDPPDMGLQTRRVLHAAARRVSRTRPPVLALAEAAENPRLVKADAAGNGALMRTFPVALGYLHDPAGWLRSRRRTHRRHDAREPAVVRAGNCGRPLERFDRAPVRLTRQATVPTTVAAAAKRRSSVRVVLAPRSRPYRNIRSSWADQDAIQRPSRRCPAVAYPVHTPRAPSPPRLLTARAAARAERFSATEATARR